MDCLTRFLAGHVMLRPDDERLKKIAVHVWMVLFVVWVFFACFLLFTNKASAAEIYSQLLHDDHDTAYPISNADNIYYQELENTGYPDPGYFDTFTTFSNTVTSVSFLVHNYGGATCTGQPVASNGAFYYCNAGGPTCTGGQITYGAFTACEALNVAPGGDQWVECTTPSVAANRIFFIGGTNVTSETNCSSTYVEYQSTDVIPNAKAASTYAEGDTSADFTLRICSAGTDCSAAPVPPDPREDPEITIGQPEDISYLSTDVPMRFASNVCEDDYPDEVPTWIVQLDSWDGDSWELVELVDFGSTHNQLIGDVCDTGYAYGFGENPFLYWDEALPDGDYQMTVFVDFGVSFPLSDPYAGEFSVGAVTPPPLPPVLDDVDYLAILDYPSATCTFEDASVGEAIVTVAECVMATLKWVFLGPTDPAGALDEMTGTLVDWVDEYRPELFIVNYAVEPIIAISNSYNANIGAECALPVLEFSGNETDLCDVLEPVRDLNMNNLVNAAFWAAMALVMIGIFFIAFGQSYDGD